MVITMSLEIEYWIYNDSWTHVMERNSYFEVVSKLQNMYMDSYCTILLWSYNYDTKATMNQINKKV